MHAPINYAKRQAKLCEVVESGTRSVVSENAITSEGVRPEITYIHKVSPGQWLELGFFFRAVQKQSKYVTYGDSGKRSGKG